MTAVRTLVIERHLPHPVAKVWRALTEGPLIQQWLMANDFEPIVGRSFTFRATPMPNWNGIIEGQVFVVEHGSSLSYSWDSAGLQTRVLWTLCPTEDGTLLRMEQTGFPEDQEANWKGAQYGWQKFLGGLEKVVASLE